MSDYEVQLYVFSFLKAHMTYPFHVHKWNVKNGRKMKWGSYNKYMEENLGTL